MYSSVIETPESDRSLLVNRDHRIRQAWKASRLVGGGAVSSSYAIKIVGALSNMDKDAGHATSIILDAWVFIFGLVMMLVEDFR
jgi:hypothetical protein